VTPELVENLVTEHMRARAVSRPTMRRTSPAVPLIAGPVGSPGRTARGGRHR
jgi:hypothetical protein